eukprot:NODE_108_length_2405_cov_235.775042_g87_i0.p1 GENE.NODE_108_length_2405_cov_235.775042_g87_i0~~NODE_108_length_2405_cov_235.775042_g87_i0.p1  ORF type:complete len:655 (-),score=205.51 NODE_108_length_2405_cov_235.775042_g87_i0:110-2074(-)
MAENTRNVIVPEVSVTVHGITLFKNADVKFSAGRRYGLVGPNGRGKSTILHLIGTREIPSPANLQILLVEQEKEVEALDSPAVQVVIDSDVKRSSMLEEVERLRGSDDDDDQERLLELEDELEAMGAQTADSRARKILSGLGFPPEWQDRPTKSFSGGWRKRIALACAVFIEPDFLMLDEPSNHLDLNAVIWLETYLPAVYTDARKRPKTLVVVSHDVEFLNTVTTDIVHIDQMKLNYYHGNYQQFLRGRKEHESEESKAFHKQQNQIKTWKKQGMSKKQIEEKMKTTAYREGKELDDVVLSKRREYVVKFPFPEPPLLREAYIVKLEDVEFHYPDCPTLFVDLNLAIWTDSRIVLCGPNGVGKTTLLNLMAGLLEPCEGKVERNHLVRVGRYSQHFVDSVPLDRTGVEYLQHLGMGDEFKCRQRLGSFGLESLRHNEPIGTLSGGQKARVAFAGISVSQPHVLLLDEPTNHLDMESIEALAASLNSFKGAVLLISHDARLIRETAKELWVMADRSVDTHSFETFEDYKDHLLELMDMDEIRKEHEREDKAYEKAAKAKKKREQARKDKADKKIAKVAVEEEEEDETEEEKKTDAVDGEGEGEDEGKKATVEKEKVEKLKKEEGADSPSASPTPESKPKKEKMASFWAKKDKKK